MSLTELLKTQISLTEWLESINHADAVLLREEDNAKRLRLQILNKIIDLPVEGMNRFDAVDVHNRAENFKTFFDLHTDELCAYRLIPKDPSLPKIRNRGASIRDTLKWFDEQTIEYSQYVVEIMPHPTENFWSTIFVVNQHGMFGEIVADAHNVLTQGFHEEAKPISFSYNFSTWALSEDNEEAHQELEKIAKTLFVGDIERQDKLKSELRAEFAQEFLCGYFESVTSECGLWFIDYNRLLGKMYVDFQIHLDAHDDTPNTLHGQTGSPGRATGIVHIVHLADVDTTTLLANEILVCTVTSPIYVPLMKQACAILTEQGGILSHAAIVSRELKKPCIVGIKQLPQLVQNGQKIDLDASQGIIYL